MEPTPAPDVLPILAPLGVLLGTWAGEGTGDYPTIEPFRYLERITFWHCGKPFLGYDQRTRHPDTDAPMHAESGYWRAVGPAAADGSAPIELVIAQPSGIVETHAGTAAPGRITLTSTQVAGTPTAKSVTAVERTIEIDGDTLTYELRMAAVGQPLQWHLGATLHRVG